MNLKNRHAVSLVEIMIAVSILAMSVLPIAGLLTYATRGTREQDAEGIAANLAKEEMNRLMYVITRDNLLNGAGTAQNWSYGQAGRVVEMKGNIFEGEYTVYTHSNSSLNFKVPQMTFHEPQLCVAGGETQTGVPGTSLDLNMQTLYPSITWPLLVDICLKIKWRLPSGAFEPRNELILIGRRAFPVEN